MSGASRKVTIVILLIVTLVLAGVAAIIAVRLQQTTSPDDAGAVTEIPKSAYEYAEVARVTDALPSYACAELIDPETLVNDTSVSDFLIGEAGLTLTKSTLSEDIGNGCIIRFTNSNLVFTVLYHIFNTEYTIETDAGTETTYLVFVPDEADIKNEFISVIEDQGELDNGYSYLFGADKLEDGQCRTIAFDPDHKLRFVNVAYGYNYDCSTLVELNKEILTQIAIGLEPILDTE